MAPFFGVVCDLQKADGTAEELTFRDVLFRHDLLKGLIERR
ncbi:hypothetical protein DB31_5837 [Hyalangium minutum]|uniref:Uncharacterized protein n=1 Tax=Hyalangium minutum TaxID=394096 RepID=A0A085WSY2_9BACT|nr:hypothetical protein DB31_5837 [Hyalangium minutum]